MSITIPLTEINEIFSKEIDQAAPAATKKPEESKHHRAADGKFGHRAGSAERDSQWIGMSDRARLLMAFDIAAMSRFELVIWERDEPDAPAALIAWAAARDIAIKESRSPGGESPAYWVMFAVGSDGRYRRTIQVYRKGA